MHLRVRSYHRVEGMALARFVVAGLPCCEGTNPKMRGGIA